MCNTKNSLLLAVTATACLSALAADPPAPTTVRQEWRFETGANPSPANPGGATATIAPGELASGWLAELPPLPGGAGGFWDLGQSGRVTLSFPQPLVGTVTVNISQWWDGSIYSDFATVTVPGAVASPGGVNLDRLGSLGGWVVDQFIWTAQPGQPVTSMVVQGSATGAVIDSIVVEAAVVSLPPLVLDIQPDPANPGTVQLSWDEALGSASVESTTDLNQPASWAPLSAPATLANGRYTVTAPAGDDVRYFRLKR